MNYTDYVLDLCSRARTASAATARLSVSAKKDLLNRIADRILASTGMIIAANGMDCAQARENGLTALMITHNMKDAINHGTRLIMMNEGHIILDVEGEEKKKLTKQQLMEKFAEIAGKQVESDRILLS